MNKDKEAAIEADLAATSTGPRLGPSDIDAKIVCEDYYRFPDTTVTVCCLKLLNGFTVVGDSACASPENFDPAIGKRIAFANAREKIWALEGYLLKERLVHGDWIIHGTAESTDRTGAR